MEDIAEVDITIINANLGTALGVSNPADDLDIFLDNGFLFDDGELWQDAELWGL